MAASSSSGKFDAFRMKKLGATGPQETTRLLLDSARIAHDTEAIGEPLVSAFLISGNPP
jgi:hypothetical protein